jgi:hypothetical protein
MLNLIIKLFTVEPVFKVGQEVVIKGTEEWELTAGGAVITHVGKRKYGYYYKDGCKSNIQSLSFSDMHDVYEVRNGSWSK